MYHDYCVPNSAVTINYSILLFLGHEMMSSGRFAVVITAAGSSSRYGPNTCKVLEHIQGVPVLIHSIQAFSIENFSEIIVTAPAEHFDKIKTLCDPIPNLKVIIGGSTRLHSVQIALEALSIRPQGVFIHDGARPNPGTDLIKRMLAKASDFEAIVPSIGVTDTIKRITPDNIIIETIPRNTIIAAQTPQYFSSRYFHCIASADPYDIKFTDESSVIENAGYKVTSVPGNIENIKLTHPEDLRRLSQIMDPTIKY